MVFPVDLDQCYLIETFGTTTGRTIPHTGDDWARKKVNGKVIAEAPDIRAVFAGTVVFAGWHGVAGNRVIIRYWFGLHGDYGHMRSIAVKVGQTVKESEKIGELGGTGVKANGQPSVTGPHLHYTQSTDLNRLLKGIYPYWKDPKSGRVLWASVDAWAKASGLQRPNYAIGSQDSKTSLEQAEEDDMYTDKDRARDDAIYGWLQTMQPQVFEIHKDVNALDWLQDRQAQEDVEAYQIAQVWARLGIIDRLGPSASAADIAAQVASKLDIPGIGPEQVQAIATAVADEQHRRLAS